MSQAVSPNVRAVLLPLHVFLGIFTYFGAVTAACMGIAEKTGFGGGYAVTAPEYNPFSHYGEIGAGFRVAFWLAIAIIVTALFATFAAMDLKIGVWQHPTDHAV